ncbi:MAG: LysR family transcriptional regulator [Pseudomonadota bacterium]
MQKFDTLQLDGRQLKLFLAILDSGSVSEAADRMRMNQSTASHHLDRLRKSLGDPLFVKLGKGITPTDHAIGVADRVRTLVAGLEGLTADISYDPATDTRPFSLATNTAEHLPLLKRLQRTLARVAPSMPVRFLELGSRSRIERLLDTGEADLVLSVGAAAYAASLVAEVFSIDQLVCFYDPAQRTAPDTIESYSAAPHAALDFGGSRKSNVTLALERAGHERHIAVTAPDMHALAELMRGTPMVATFQSDLTSSVFAGFETCAVPVRMPAVSHDLIWHRRMDASMRNRWFRQLLRDEGSG